MTSFIQSSFAHEEILFTFCLNLALILVEMHWSYISPESGQVADFHEDDYLYQKYCAVDNLL